jgi:hypothetical protein
MAMVMVTATAATTTAGTAATITITGITGTTTIRIAGITERVGEMAGSDRTRAMVQPEPQARRRSDIKGERAAPGRKTSDLSGRSYVGRKRVILPRDLSCGTPVFATR